MFKNLPLKITDPAIFATIEWEFLRENDGMELIASENYTSPAVQEALGSIFVNKYAEGFPGKRYYGGQEFTDEMETIAIERAKKIFHADHANVQALSGAAANVCIYNALLEPGDTILGMDLSHGGHLTHGSPVTLMSKVYNFVRYKTSATHNNFMDYDNLREMALEHKPKLIIAGASAYSKKIDFERIGKLAKEVGAIFMVDMAHYAGLIAAGVYPNPVPHADIVTSTTHKSLRGPRGGIILMKAEHEKAINSAVFPGLQGGPLMHVIAGKAAAFKEAQEPSFIDYQKQVVANAKALAETLIERGLRIVSGGTDSHVMLVDLRAKKMTGKEAERVLGEAHITCNKNGIPNDPEKPMVTSGIRLGSPAMTTRGFKEAEARQVGNFIADVLDNPNDADNIAKVRAQVAELTKRFPVYG